MRDVIEVILPIGKGRVVRLDSWVARRLLARGLAMPVDVSPPVEAASTTPTPAPRKRGR